jgi:GTP cyclohydrolase IB
VSARIMRRFEAESIDTFIKILHAHRDRIGTKTVRTNIKDYFTELEAISVTANFDYPFFVEKQTPVSKEKCLVAYACTYSAKMSGIEPNGRIQFSIKAPCITTYPASVGRKGKGLFGQLSIVTIDTRSSKDIYPEDLVEIVDTYALSPVYSYLSNEDQVHLIEKIHTEEKTSVVMVNEIKSALAKIRDIEWYSVRCANHGMLHSYHTLITTEKSQWVPFSGYGEADV